MGSGPDAGSLGPMAPNPMGPVMNGDGLDGMKNSPANGGPGTPREDNSGGMGEYSLGSFGGPAENVSIANNVSSVNSSFPVKKEEAGNNNWKTFAKPKDEVGSWNASPVFSNECKTEDGLEWGYPDLFEGGNNVKTETVGTCRSENRNDGNVFQNQNWSYSMPGGRMGGSHSGEASGHDQKQKLWSGASEVSSSTVEKGRRNKKF